MGDEVISTVKGIGLVPLFAMKIQKGVEKETGSGTSRDRQTETEGH